MEPWWWWWLIDGWLLMLDDCCWLRVFFDWFLNGVLRPIKNSACFVVSFGRNLVEPVVFVCECVCFLKRRGCAQGSIMICGGNFSVFDRNQVKVKLFLFDTKMWLKHLFSPCFLHHFWCYTPWNYHFRSENRPLESCRFLLESGCLLFLPH